MKHNNQSQLIKFVLSLTTIALLTACDVDSTSVTDDNLIATFLVQNDNGQANTTVTFATRDFAGDNTVDLVGVETIWYEQSGVSGELHKSRDGEYTGSLPSEAAGWYSFRLVRETGNNVEVSREIIDNHAFLPGSFQSLQAEPLQVGPVISINWALDDNALQSIDGFIAERSEDTFNAIATCQVENETMDLAITEGSIVQQSGISLLDIRVTEHLQQVIGLSAAVIATTSCEFDVQLVRTVIGVTDTSLDRRSSASGQFLHNVTIQWAGQ